MIMYIKYVDMYNCILYNIGVYEHGHGHGDGDGGEHAHEMNMNKINKKNNKI
jgi:hypothetical protein